MTLHVIRTEPVQEGCGTGTSEPTRFTRVVSEGFFVPEVDAKISFQLSDREFIVLSGFKQNVPKHLVASSSMFSFDMLEIQKLSFAWHCLW